MHIAFANISFIKGLFLKVLFVATRVIVVAIIMVATIVLAFVGCFGDGLVSCDNGAGGSNHGCEQQYDVLFSSPWTISFP